MTVKQTGLILACLVALTGCATTSPACPYSGAENIVANAGCYVTKNRQVLLVEQVDGKVSVPGGGSENNEPAQCTAHRETWEETGLNVKPEKIQKVFDNGFYLFKCSLPSTELLEATDPPFSWEVKKAFWLSVDQFESIDWRFPEQVPLLKQWLKEEQAIPK